MLKQKYFLTDFFILSAEKQPIKLSWRNIEWLLVDGVEGLAMNNRDAIGDTYKYILAKMAAYECLEVEKVQRKSN